MAEIPGPADALAVLMQENMFQAEEHMAEIPGPADEPLPSQPPVPLEVGAADVDLQRATLASLGHDVDSVDEDFRAALLALVEDEEFVSAMDGSSSSRAPPADPPADPVPPQAARLGIAVLSAFRY